jgi:hypothetical protein
LPAAFVAGSALPEAGLRGAALPGRAWARAGPDFAGAAALPGGRPRAPRVSFAAMGLIHYTASAK